MYRNFLQAGRVFADIQSRALKRVVELGRFSLAAGGGISGGGQDRPMRLDAGAAACAMLPVGDAHVRVDASWRWRIAGQAMPGKGPAVTLSTSFEAAAFIPP